MLIKARDAKLKSNKATDKMLKKFLNSINYDIKQANKIGEYSIMYRFGILTDINIINKIIDHLNQQGYNVEYHLNHYISINWEEVGALIMISAKEAKEKSKYIHDKKIKKQEKELARKINKKINRSIKKGLFEVKLNGDYLESFFEEEAVINFVKNLQSSDDYNVELVYSRVHAPGIHISWNK